MSTPYQTEEYRAYDRARRKERLKGLQVLAVQLASPTLQSFKNITKEQHLNMQIVAKLLIESFIKDEIKISVNMEAK